MRSPRSVPTARKGATTSTPTSTAGRSGPIAKDLKEGRFQSRLRGLTLIELMVAMTIVGILFALAATGLRNALDVNLKTGARQMAATLRFLHNKAVTDHLYLRMVYDLEGQGYWVEESTDPFVVSRTEEADSPPRGEKKKEEGEEGSKEGGGGEGPPPPKPAFSPSESSLLKKTSLPSGVFFKGVFIAYLGGEREKGQVSTYFFPDGYATETVIHLRDEDDQSHFSIEVEPLTGRVKVEEGLLEGTGKQTL